MARQSPTTGATSVARDRISQIYLGRVGDAETQVAARARIDWLAAQATGSTALDIGCSEGILAILLARRGFAVTGVDLNADALAVAAELLDSEPEEVRSRVRWIQADVFHCELPAASFDTVILGEILEHLTDPTALLRVARRSLSPGGRLLVTTPLGYFPDPDHRQTFTLSEFVNLLRDTFAPEQLEVVDGYIRFAGRLSDERSTGWERYATAQSLLTMVEEALLCVQQRLYQRIERQVQLQGAAQAEVARLRQAADTFAAKHAEALRDVQRWRQSCEELTGKRQQALDDLQRWKATAEQVEARRQQAVAELARVQEQRREDAQRWQAQIGELAAKRRSLLEDVQRWKRMAEETAHKRQQTLAELQQSAERQRQMVTQFQQMQELLRGERQEVARLTALLEQARTQLQSTSEELAALQRSAAFRLGTAMVAAARASRDALLLPLRLWPILRRSGR